MALNFSRRPMFPNYSSEEGLVSPINFGKNPDGFANTASCRGFDWELENSHDYRREKGEKGKGVSCGEPVSDEILDLLPADPFGMDIRSTFTAITGWIEDVKDLGSGSYGCKTDEADVKRLDHLFAGLNLVWNGAMMFQPEVGNLKINENPNSCDDFNGFMMGNGSYDGGFISNGNMQEFLSFRDVGDRVVSNQANGLQCCHHDDNGGAPHDAMLFALGYLGLKDLLVVERVCRSLRDAVRGDPLLWKSVHINPPLSEKITDESLFQLTSRAQGTLQCLSLVECLKITNNGLKRVLECNPGLTKLSVPGCVRLTIDGILLNLKAFKSASITGIKNLRIGGLLGVTNKHFEELTYLLGADNPKQRKDHKPRFYRGGHFYLSCDDDRAIDIEACPRCQKVKLVYDCPAESCQKKQHPSTQLCRACVLCIARCIHCGRCIKDCDYEETFCLDPLCLDCWKELVNYEERLREQDATSSMHTIFHQETRYHFCLYG